MRKRLSLLVCALGCLFRSAATASDMSLVLHWPNRTYIWHYNPDNRPAWLGEDEAFELIRTAVAGWEACGATLRYAGMTRKPAGMIDGENVVGWRIDGKNFSAWTTWAAHRDGRAIEADVTLYSNIYDAYRRRGIDAKLEIRKSVIHEFGHILGLTHSDRPEDAMAVMVRTRPEWHQPSANDLARCRGIHGG